MIIKSYQVQKNKSDFLKCNLYLLYGENVGLKKDIKNLIKSQISGKNDDNIEDIFLYENEILDDEESLYNFIYSGSLFSEKKIITIYDGTDKIIEKINNIYEKYPENTSIIIFSNILEKKSKLRIFFEKNKKTICVPCYLDNDRDLTTIARLELKKNNISLSQEIINLLIEKSNSDRDNLRNEINKVHAYSIGKKKMEIENIKSLINFSGDYKSDIFINECLCGNIKQYKKIISELYSNTVNQIFLLRILSNKIQRLLKMKVEESKLNNIDNIISNIKPSIFWMEKPLVKKQLSIWSLEDLKKIINEINNTELLCKKNPNISKVIFFNFFTSICKKANNVS
jgi:DNA polymerase-3 subunit delta|tara:strand:- start:2806 stop:3828 length:1023 start_codon:yes stop_codon:yes gene_type:complete